VASGSFREDLLYRINTIPIEIPPLRARTGDVALLARHFLVKYAAHHRRPARSFEPAVLARLEAHPWRGNVRELEHSVEALVLFSETDVIGTGDLPRALRSRESVPAIPTSSGSFADAVSDFERRLLADAIAQAGGVKAEAARRLGLDPNQIKYLCRKYGL
jgi:DNA-binding NtrC family response regulator